MQCHQQTNARQSSVPSRAHRTSARLDPRHRRFASESCSPTFERGSRARDVSFPRRLYGAKLGIICPDGQFPIILPAFPGTSSVRCVPRRPNPVSPHKCPSRARTNGARQCTHDGRRESASG